MLVVAIEVATALAALSFLVSADGMTSRASLAVVLLVIAVNPLFEELFEVAYNTRALEKLRPLVVAHGLADWFGLTQSG